VPPYCIQHLIQLSHSSQLFLLFHEQPSDDPEEGQLAVLETVAAQAHGEPPLDDGHLSLGRAASALQFGKTRPLEPSFQLDRIP